MTDNPTAAPKPPPVSLPPMSAPPPGPAPAPVENAKSAGKLNSPLSVVLTALVLAGLLFLALNYFVSAITHESTDDAFIAGHIISIAPRVAGQVVAVHVTDNQLVNSNDVLAEIDPADFATTLAQKKAAQDSENSSYKAAIAAYELMGVKVKTAQADVQTSQADVAAAQATETQAKADFERAQTLIKDQTISAQEFDRAKATIDKAEADLNAARQKEASDESKVDEAQSEEDASWAEAGAVLAQFKQSGTEVDSAKLNLSYTKIFAPGDGTRHPQTSGSGRLSGSRPADHVPRAGGSVGDANFKESQLEENAARPAGDSRDRRARRPEIPRPRGQRPGRQRRAVQHVAAGKCDRQFRESRAAGAGENCL